MTGPVAPVCWILSDPFMRTAFGVGAAIALACGLVGYFVVFRSQVFTGDALSHVAFTGSLAALVVGVNPRVGLFVATALVAAGMSVLGGKGKADDVVIGSVFAWILALGVFFLSLYTANRSGANGTAGVAILFGSIFGLSGGDAAVAVSVGAVVAASVLAVARPLLFASIDGAVAEARGVPVRWLGVAFLVLVGLTAAEATQVVGALPLLGLLAAPAAAAHRLTDRPFRGLALSGLLAVGSTWAGLAVAYYAPSVPASFAIVASAVTLFAGASVAGGRIRRMEAVPARAGPVGVEGPVR